MILIMHLDPNTYDNIKMLVNLGKYNSVESFTEIAVKNQIVLESANAEGLGPSGTQIQVATQNQSSTAENLPRQLEVTQSLNELEEAYCVEKVEITEDRKKMPIFGLINRFAPAKLVLRLLSREILRERTRWIDLDHFSKFAVLDAVNLRQQIERNGHLTSVTRGEGIHIGFPRKDAKSQQRFIDLYIGKVRSDKRITGLLGDLELASITRESDGHFRIGITNSGMEWVKMNSPLLDEFAQEGRPIQRAISEDETRFLLSHIQQCRPGEFNFLNHIYKSIAGGKDTPEKIAQEVKAYARKYSLSNTNGRALSDIELNTLKVGGTARLVEMRLIKIKKEGIRSFYDISGSFSDLKEFTH